MLLGFNELLLGSAKSYLGPRRYRLGSARTRSGSRHIPHRISANRNGFSAIPVFLSEIPIAICCDRHIRVRIAVGSGLSRLAISRRKEANAGRPARSGTNLFSELPAIYWSVWVSPATCTFHSCVLICTDRTTHLTSVFLCVIRNLLWASGGNSSRNATCFGCVCVDRFGSWCFCALSAGFWANFRAMVEHTMERPGVKSNQH